MIRQDQQDCAGFKASEFFDMNKLSWERLLKEPVNPVNPVG
jgi:hypothetical protein